MFQGSVYHLRSSKADEETEGLAAIKARVNVQKPSEADLAGDNELFYRLAETEVSQEAAGRFLELSGDESDGGFELGVPGDLVEIVS